MKKTPGIKFQIRNARPNEYEKLGRMTVDALSPKPDGHSPRLELIDPGKNEAGGNIPPATLIRPSSPRPRATSYTDDG